MEGRGLSRQGSFTDSNSQSVNFSPRFAQLVRCAAVSVTLSLQLALKLLFGGLRMKTSSFYTNKIGTSYASFIHGSNTFKAFFFLLLLLVIIISFFFFFFFVVFSLT